MIKTYTYKALLSIVVTFLVFMNGVAQDIYFTENIGQITNQFGKQNTDVKYILSTSQYNVSFYNDHFAYEVFSASEKDSNKTNVERIELWFDSKENAYNISNLLAVESKTNVYSNEIAYTNIKSFKKLIYHNVWKGVDIEFSIQNNLLKYNYIIKNQEIKELNLLLKGATVSQQNDKLLFRGASKTITEAIPECYFSDKNNVKELSTLEIKTTAKSIRYKLPPKRTTTFVIDPIAYGEQYTTYYGGTHMDFAYSIQTTKANEVVIAGFTLSTNNIATTGAYQTTVSTQDAFIAKFDQQGNRIWGTYFGGNDEERVYTMALDTNENIIIAGNTTSTMGLATAGAQQLNIASSDDAFLAQFNPSGQLVWSTYLGGNNHELITHVEIDKQNKIYVTGHTSSSDFPCSPGADRNTLSGFENTFLGVYDNSGLLLYNSYYLSGSSNIGEGIAIAEDGTIYFSGTTNDTTTIANTNIHQTQNGGLLDGFIIKISPSFQTIWTTYLGGSLNDIINDLAIDSLQNLYIIGKTKSNNAISTAGTFQTTYSNDWDGFIVKLDSSSTQTWGTYLGGAAIDELSSVSQKDSTLWLLGFTNGNIPITDSSSTQVNIQGGMDNIVLKFDLDGNKIWGTYLGGANDDFGRDLSVDNSNNIFIAGQTASISGFSTSNAHQTTYGGHVYDGFWTKLCNPLFPTTLSIIGDISICEGDIISVNSINTFTDYSWNTGSNTSLIDIDTSGKYVLNTIDANGCPGRSDTLTVNVIPTQSVSIISSSSVICYNDSLLLSIDTTYNSYTWNNGNNTINQYVQTTGDYSATVIDNFGCQYQSDTISLSSNQYNFPVNIIGDTLICINGSSILFTPETFNQITWNTNENTSSITVDTTGLYYFTGVDLNNCPIVSDSISISAVNYTASGLILDTLALFEICWNDSISLTAENNFSSYSWSNGDTTQASILNQEGFYYVSATDSNGCVGISDSVQISYLSDGAATISHPFGLEFCQGDNIALLTESGLTNISWNNSSLNASLLTIDSSGTYFYSATDISSCMVLSDTINTIMYPTPQIFFAPLPDSICTNDSLFIACNSPNIINYNWSNGEVDSSFYTMYSDTGNYTLTLTVSDNYSCENSSTLTLNVIDCVYETIDENNLILEFEISISNDVLVVSSDLTITEVSLIDMNGRLLTKSKTSKLSIEDIAFGTYIAMIRFNETDQIGSKKITLIKN